MMNYKTILVCAIVAGTMQQAWGMDKDSGSEGNNNQNTSATTNDNNKPNTLPSANDNNNPDPKLQAPSSVRPKWVDALSDW
jgi:hypothetical protein